MPKQYHSTLIVRNHHWLTIAVAIHSANHYRQSEALSEALLQTIRSAITDNQKRYSQF